MFHNQKKKFLVAPLNWGLGHATRCIPIINGLIDNGFEPVIASDGVALELLKKEFPNVITFELPSYNIQYPEKGKNFKWKMITQIPKIISAVQNEQKAIAKILDTHKFDGIISDNRLGVYSKKVPSVFITHQLNVLSGRTTFITSKTHQKIIAKHKECWVPDFETEPNFSGNLSHLGNNSFKLKYIGILSRLKPSKVQIKYNLLVLLSGPEPQRTLLENKLLFEYM